MSNLGAYGVKNFAPIVHMPQACALAIGAAEERVIPNEGGRVCDVARCSRDFRAVVDWN